MSYCKTHKVPPLLVPIRLQEYGVGIFDTVSTKSALKKLLKKNCITVNGEIATTATFIKGGETITLSIPENIKPKRALVFPLQVLFEDEYLAIINKPAGIEVSANRFKTITNALPQNIKPSSLEDRSTPQPVHRIDYATTGVLLIGKTHTSIRALNQLFESKKIKKTYLAITIGTMKPQGIIAIPIDDKEASSSYEVIDSVASERFARLNLVQLIPKTGRRHQLRKHVASIGNPILGDKDYCKEGLLLKRKGMYLHAYSLQFIHPSTGKVMYIQTEIPKRFKKIFPTTVF